MKALVYEKYGQPDVLHIQEISMPVPEDNQVLIKVHATTVNRTDSATIRAIPFFARIITGLFAPKNKTPGSDFAGMVEAIGNKVTALRPGDRVFGFDDQGSGAHAEYLVTSAEKAAVIPENISYKQAAASAEGAHYATNFLNKVKIEKGQKVLVNGATGAIGSAALQLLKYYETNVTAVCGTENVEKVLAMGADRVIDYQKEDFTQDKNSYDYVFDSVGKSSFFKCKKLLKPGGVYMSSELGYMAQNIYLPLITKAFKPLFDGKSTRFPIPFNVPATLHLMQNLLQQGKFVPLIDQTMAFDKIVDAYWYVQKGHKIGNVIIEME